MNIQNGFKGEVLNGDSLDAIIKGLKDNDLLTHSHLLTGYNRNDAFLRAVIRTVVELKVYKNFIVFVIIIICIKLFVLSIC